MTKLSGVGKEHLALPTLTPALKKKKKNPHIYNVKQIRNYFNPDLLLVH